MNEAALLAGQLLVTGFEDSTLSASSERALARGERAGVILFKRNLSDLEGTRALTKSVHLASARAHQDRPPLVAVDEEGGRVSRLPASELRLPPMRVLGAIGDASLVRDAARALGARLLELGFNLDFAPVLDVDSNPKNPVIGDRSFASSAATVAELGVAFAAGLEQGGILACGKHFPGHGDTDQDSHFALPIIRHDRARLDALELVPFRAAARAGIDAIMSAHIVIEAIESGLPATFSRAAMTDLLRRELGFEGVLVSDDLEMRAVSADTAPEAGAVLAVAAGCDLVLVCKEEAAAERAHEALAKEIENSPTFAVRAREAATRVIAMRDKAGRLALRAPSSPSAPSLADVLARIEAARTGREVLP